MDTSETYIKMCDCSEVQGEWKSGDNARKRGDTYWVKSHHDNDLKDRDRYLKKFSNNFVSVPWADYIFLPRQDQIQAWFPVNHPVQLIASMRDWMHTPPDLSISAWSNYITQFLTFEQLWLALWFSKIHGLTWTGEKWE